MIIRAIPRLTRFGVVLFPPRSHPLEKIQIGKGKSKKINNNDYIQPPPLLLGPLIHLLSVGQEQVKSVIPEMLKPSEADSRTDAAGVLDLMDRCINSFSALIGLAKVLTLGFLPPIGIRIPPPRAVVDIIEKLDAGVESDLDNENQLYKISGLQRPVLLPKSIESETHNNPSFDKASANILSTILGTAADTSGLGSSLGAVSLMSKHVMIHERFLPVKQSFSNYEISERSKVLLAQWHWTTLRGLSGNSIGLPYTGLHHYIDSAVIKQSIYDDTMNPAAIDSLLWSSFPLTISSTSKLSNIKGVPPYMSTKFLNPSLNTLTKLPEGLEASLMDRPIDTRGKVGGKLMNVCTLPYSPVFIPSSGELGFHNRNFSPSYKYVYDINFEFPTVYKSFLPWSKKRLESFIFSNLFWKKYPFIPHTDWPDSNYSILKSSPILPCLSAVADEDKSNPIFSSKDTNILSLYSFGKNTKKNKQSSRSKEENQNNPESFISIPPVGSALTLVVRDGLEALPPAFLSQVFFSYFFLIIILF
jgi:hypothetical protein